MGDDTASNTSKETGKWTEDSSRSGGLGLGRSAEEEKSDQYVDITD